MKKTMTLLAGVALFLASCGGGDTQSETAAPEAAATETAPSETETPAATGAVAEVTINGGDDMKYDLTEIKVKEGQTVKLTLHHTGKLPATAMGHNFILLAQGANLDDFANAAISAQATDYIPAGHEGDIIAHTKLIGGGESDTIEFPAPPKGTYEFFCSFPGHHSMMKGTFVVE